MHPKLVLYLMFQLSCSWDIVFAIDLSIAWGQASPSFYGGELPWQWYRGYVLEIDEYYGSCWSRLPRFPSKSDNEP